MRTFQFLSCTCIFLILTIGCTSTNSIVLSNQSTFKKAIHKAEISLAEYDLSLVESLLKNDLATQSSNQRLDSLLISSKYEFALGNFREAKKIVDYAYQLSSQQATSQSVFEILTWQGRLFIEWLDVNNAKKVLEKANKLKKESQKINSSSYHYWQYYWALLKITEKEYSQADSTLTRLLATPNLKQLPHNLFYKASYRLGESKGEQELFKEADSILIKTLLVITKEKGKQHFLRIHTLNHLGRIYGDMEKYEEGIESYLEALSIANKHNLNIQHPVYSNIVINHGQLLIRTGKYDKAEELILKGEPTIYNTFGNSSRYALMLANLIVLYNSLGHKEKAINYTLKQRDIYKNSERYSDYVRVLHSLSSSYQDLQKYELAEQMLQEGISILRDKDQSQTSLYVLLLMDYAYLKIDTEDFVDARKISEEARTVLVKIYSTKHPWYATLINNLAYIYKVTKDYSKAKNNYLEAEKIDSTTLGIRHPYYIGTTYNLGGIHELTKETSLAKQYYQSANTGQVNLIYNYYSGFDEAIRLSYLAETEPDFHKFLSFAWRNHQELPTLTTEAQNLNLAVKNLALDFSAQKQIQATDIQDSSLLKTYQEWTDVKKQLSKSYIQTPEEQEQSGINIDQLEHQAESLEKELVRNEVLSMEELANQHRTTFEEIKGRLTTKQAAIDFIRFPYYAPERKTDSIYYCALINRNTYEQPALVYLGEEKEIKRLLRANVQLDGGNYVENERVGNLLYQQIWQPIEPYLEGVNQIAVSGSGLLYKVSFGAMKNADQSPLINQYNFTYYDNLKYINQTAIPTFDSNQSIALMGAATFDLDSIQLVDLAKQRQSPILENTIELPTLEEYAEEEEAVATRSGVVFNYLPATKKEVQNIAQQFQSKNWQVSTYTDLEAVEEQFKILEGEQAPSILHIATHGYFFEPLKEGRKVPNNARGRIMAAKNPLLRAGLAFSGANYAWKKGKTLPNVEDGILTAYEIASQNLAKTNLVVLSACETGLGDAVSGEGVFGLQRAFKMAGVEDMLISLWQVPDQQTQELMAAFYKYYLESGDAATALHQAQLELSKTYRPFYWGGFILAR